MDATYGPKITIPINKTIDVTGGGGVSTSGGYSGSIGLNINL
jgi:hypothetical protein